MATNKIIGGSLRQRKSVNGFPGPAVSGVQRDSGSSRTSPLHRNPGSEKLQQSSLACDKALDVPAAEEIGHKFIVKNFKIPNRGRSPAQSSSGGTLEDTLVMNSRDSSPVPSERHDHNDFKEVLTGSPATVPDDEHGQMGDDAGKLGEVSKDTPSSNVYVHKFGKLHDASFSSMNALIESCAKYSEGNASMSVGDAVGMNLLASVAAGEISKSDMVSPIDSPRRNMPIEHPCAPSGSRAKSSPCDVPAQSHGKPVDGVDDEDEKRDITVGTSLSKNTEAKTVLFSQKKRTGELNGPPNSSHLDGHQIAEPCLESNVKSEEMPAAAVSSASMAVKTSNSSGKEPWEKEGGGRSNLDGISDDKEKLHSSVLNEINNTGVQVGTDAVDASSSNHPVEAVGENKKNMNKELDVSFEDEPKPPAMMRSEFAKGTNDGVLKPSSSGKDVVSENMHDVKAGETDGRSHSTEKNKIEHECNTASATTDYEGEELGRQSGADETEECMSAPAAASLSATGGSDLEATFSGGSASYVDSPSGGRLCFPTLPSQVLAPVGAMSSHYPKPSHAVNFPDSNNNSAVESSRKWGRQVLDLNAGPLGPDIEGRDETSTLGSRQLSFASSRVLTEEQLRMCQVTSGGVLKKKEPEDGLEGYKQSSWE
ncbi:hypothetical protein OIU77_015118 [Salix suchowensis]|uniref:Uncharacterized protein n=1 Tax=Salix suchowensis TaxID=1278906 RepID=A0ABQ8ZSY4_9ROSI|nr:hypothetical protein OIU77_015118 [Salix suchowensis]